MTRHRRTFDFTTEIEIPLSILVRVTGHTDDGKGYRHIDDETPPEHEEEREILSITLPDGTPLPVTPEIMKAIEREDIDIAEEGILEE